jgi:NAD(P)-dependent dehydrogenase (short-subunit alcohol dehydrogenase family)
VVINGRDPSAVERAAARVGGSTVGVPGSPADPTIAGALIDSCISEFGRIDALINCAGTAEPAGSSVLNVTSGQFRDLLDTHLGTVFETCRAAAPKMVAQGGGATSTPARSPSSATTAERAIRRARVPSTD